MPDGEILQDGSEVARGRRELSMGFYYVWDWPNNTPDEDWLLARRNWARCVRKELQDRAGEHYDSPLLVYRRIQTETLAGAREPIHVAWKEWVAQKDKPQPPTRAVWISNYVIGAAIHWLGEQKHPAIVWYEHKAVGDAFRAQGLPVFGAGQDPPSKAIKCCASQLAHGTGKNLQAWSRALVLSFPSGNTQAEQLVGRLHRAGQLADEVEFGILQHTDVLCEALQRARREASEKQDMSGQRQKLCTGSYLTTETL